MAQGAKGGRVDHLDGIRALAICAVLSLHWLSWYSPLLHGGSIGVDVFFVLSGFIITTMLWRKPGAGSVGARWRAFVIRRVKRLYPALLGLVAGALVLYAVTPDAPVGVVEVARRGLLTLGQGSAAWAMTQSGSFWLPGLHPFSQTWSLAVEWYFYLLWPVAVLVARGRNVSARSFALGCVAVAVPLYVLSLALDDFAFYFGPSARFAELLAGAVLALWTRTGGEAVHNPQRPWRRARLAPALAVAAICAITLLAPSPHSPLYRFVDVPVAVAATLVLIQVGYAAPDSPVVRLLSHRWVTLLGRCSYSLYLWHLVPMLLLGTGWLPVPVPVLGLLVVVSTIVLTATSYRFLEQPFLRGRRDVLASSSGPDARPVPSPGPAPTSVSG